MKTFLPIVSVFVVSLLALSCGQKSHEHDAHEHGDGAAVEAEGNQALYNEVMKLHDDGMAKMNDMYSAKGKLAGKIVPGMPNEKKAELESAISKLDSAHTGMMEWMHQFSPLPDSTGVEQAREYLENEMEKVKKVKEDIDAALAKASAIE